MYLVSMCLKGSERDHIICYRGTYGRVAPISAQAEEDIVVWWLTTGPMCPTSCTLLSAGDRCHQRRVR